MGHNFKSYQHVDRINSANTQDLLEGICHVFPKLDGTNGSIWYNVDLNVIECGSRNHTLTADNTNQGFWNYVNQTELGRFANFFRKYPYLRLYGEWMFPLYPKRS